VIKLRQEVEMVEMAKTGGHQRTEYGYSFGETTYPNGGCYGPMTKSYAMLVMIERGEALIEFDGHGHRIAAGRTACVLNRSSLVIHYPRSVFTKSSWCETQPAALSAAARKSLGAAPADVQTTKRLETLQKLGLELGLQSEPSVNSLRNALGQTVFSAFLHDAHVASVEEPIPRSILRARQFIDEHYEEDCSLGVIARAAAVSPQHLVHSFRKFFDTTPIRYVWQLRLAKGANLLQRSGLSVTEVAYQCGYKNPYHFSRQVKDHYGCSPTELRQRRGYRESSMELEQIEDVIY
jgi:AraC family L-rhamnose operon regulatory protein RhaS